MPILDRYRRTRRIRVAVHPQSKPVRCCRAAVSSERASEHDEVRKESNLRPEIAGLTGPALEHVTQFGRPNVQLGRRRRRASAGRSHFPHHSCCCRTCLLNVLLIVPSLVRRLPHAYTR